MKLEGADYLEAQISLDGLPETKEEAVLLIDAAAEELFLDRQRSYGNKNISMEEDDECCPNCHASLRESLGKDSISLEEKTSAILTRANDKIKRSKTLLKKREACKLTGSTFTFDGETIEDSLMDMLNYARIAMMVERDWWRLPTEEERKAQRAVS